MRFGKLSVTLKNFQKRELSSLVWQIATSVDFRFTTFRITSYSSGSESTFQCWRSHMIAAVQDTGMNNRQIGYATESSEG